MDLLCSASDLLYEEKAFTRLLGEKYLAISHSLILPDLFATNSTEGYSLPFGTILIHY